MRLIGFYNVFNSIYKHLMSALLDIVDFKKGIFFWFLMVSINEKERVKDEL